MTLRTLAAARNLRIGAAVHDRGLAMDNGYRDKLRYEFNSVTPETAMKWVNLEPEPGVHTWEKADAVVAFAQQNNQMVRGHTLVWHGALPTWISNGSLTDEELRAALRQHVETTVTRYAGRVAVWDVVNEALAEDGSLKQTIWFKRLGPGYIADAFRWARAADPSAKLYINDYNAEWSNPKRAGLYNLVRDLRAQGVPIDGVGFQTHSLIKDPTPETILPTQLKSTLELFAGLGVDVAVTELDVRIKMPVDERKLAAQAEIYRRTTAACVAVSRCVSLTVWSVTDRYSWVPSVVPGWGAAHPLDTDLAKKPAYAQMQAVLVDRDFTSASTAGHSGKCLTTQLTQAACSGGADQRLLFRRMAPKVYQIADSPSGQCLTIGAGNTLVRRACAADSADQRFELRPLNQGHQLMSVRTYKCVAVKDGSTAAGAAIEQASCSAAPAWRLPDAPGHL
ncbi:endo-1,4-beta-xylanase [Nonomuraea sp. NPDC049152]|uniref:endo-1,4-beta-xylanase n=1 Tax=Nonomuraea sp. NPDC049152 TaxID=3154350 RepID=UPI003401717B